MTTAALFTRQGLCAQCSAWGGGSVSVQGGGGLLRPFPLPSPCSCPVRHFWGGQRAPRPKRRVRCVETGGGERLGDSSDAGSRPWGLQNRVSPCFEDGPVWVLRCLGCGWLGLHRGLGWGASHWTTSWPGPDWSPAPPPRGHAAVPKQSLKLRRLRAGHTCLLASEVTRLRRSRKAPSPDTATPTDVPD